MATRRRCLSLFPAALAGGVSARVAAQQPAPPAAVTKAAIDCAESITGIHEVQAHGAYSQEGGKFARRDGLENRG